MSDSISLLLERVAEVCPLPATAQRVMTLTASERSTIPEVAQVISTDPALAAAVLRIANSATYGASRTGELEVAIMRMGLQELHELSAAMSMLAAFRNPGELSLQLHDASVLSGAVARRLAKELGGVKASTAFTCGLLSEIGAMACLVVDGQDYATLYQECRDSPPRRLAREIERFEASSFEIGSRFLLKNGLPEEVARAIGADLAEAAQSSDCLVKYSVLARHCPRVLVALGRGAAREEAVQQLETLAQGVAVADLDGERLLNIAIKAGVVAETALRATRSTGGKQ
jgi:HD-like signal output (HDOD) protein